jgi:hypothetical protein
MVRLQSAVEPRVPQRFHHLISPSPNSSRTNLFQEAQIAIAEALGIQSVAQLGIPWINFFDLRGPLLREAGHVRRRQCRPEKLATSHRITLLQNWDAVKLLQLPVGFTFLDSRRQAVGSYWREPQKRYVQGH